MDNLLLHPKFVFPNGEVQTTYQGNSQFVDKIANLYGIKLVDFDKDLEYVGQDTGEGWRLKPAFRDLILRPDIGLSATNIATYFDKVRGVNIGTPSTLTSQFFTNTITVLQGHFTAENQLGDEAYITLDEGKTVSITKTRFYTNAPVTTNTIVNLVKNGGVVATGTILAGQKTIVNNTSAFSFINGEKLQIKFVSGDSQIQFNATIIGTIN